MKPCEQCPSDPHCTNCLDRLGTSSLARKVIPPREVTLLQIGTKETMKAELLAVSRLAIGINTRGPLASGRYEVELAPDFRIIGSTAGGLSDDVYHVMDIEKVLRKDSFSARLKLEEFQSWHLSSELEPGSLVPHSLMEEKQFIIKQELEKLAILHHMQEMYLIMYEAGQLRPLNEFTLAHPEEQELRRMIQQALESSRPVREQLIAQSSDQIYDVHIIPLEGKQCGIGIMNITEVIAKEQERNRQEWETCKALLQLFTNGKLELLHDHELYNLLLKSEKLYTHAIRTPEDLKNVRETIRKVLEPFGLRKNQILHFLVAVNEAASNSLRHSRGGQIGYYLAKEERLCRIVISDQGHGIKLNELPKAALIQGYSTSHSLGSGFQAMLSFADKVFMNSSSKGTIIVLELHL